jgi:hypothetical protein
MAEKLVTRKPHSMPSITFKTKLFNIGTWTILRLPEHASAKLPSRGQVMVEGTFNDVAIQTPLEPDGKWSHWFRVNTSLLKAAKATTGDAVTLKITPIKDWPEPDVPADLKKALAANADANALWQRITPMARWEWIRWTRSTNKSETRQRRVEVACSKLTSGERRPCCWNRNLSTEPSVSKNGVLLDPTITSK